MINRQDFHRRKLQLPLKDLAPGEYTCQINVIDEVGRKFAYPREQIVITQ